MKFLPLSEFTFPFFNLIKFVHIFEKYFSLQLFEICFARMIEICFTRMIEICFARVIEGRQHKMEVWQSREQEREAKEREERFF